MRQQSAIFFILLIIGSNVMNATQAYKKIDIKAKLNPITDDKIIELLESGSKYVVDEVLDLLANLEDAAIQDLQDLNAAWAVQENLLTSLWQGAKSAWQFQQGVCDSLEAQQHDLENQISNLKAERQANNDQIQEDADLIQKLKEERCKASQLYVDHIIYHREAISLFEALEELIDQYQAGTFLQKQAMQPKIKTLGDIINIFVQTLPNRHASDPGKVGALSTELHRIFSKKNPSAEQQLFLPDDYYKQFDTVEDYAGNKEYQGAGAVQDRSDVGTGHVDNDQDQITLEALDADTVRSLANIKAQLIKILNELIEAENANYSSLQVAEANANEAAAAYKKRLQDEQRSLTRRNEKLSLQIAQLEVRLAEKTDEVEDCREQEHILDSVQNKAHDNLVEATGVYLDRKDTLENEIALFHKLYLFYKEQVYNRATQADRQRIEDYSNNQNFENTADYTHKSAFDIDTSDVRLHNPVVVQSLDGGEVDEVHRVGGNSAYHEEQRTLSESSVDYQGGDDKSSDDSSSDDDEFDFDSSSSDNESSSDDDEYDYGFESSDSDEESEESSDSDEESEESDEDYGGRDFSSGPKADDYNERDEDDEDSDDSDDE